MAEDIAADEAVDFVGREREFSDQYVRYDVVVWQYDLQGKLRIGLDRRMFVRGDAETNSRVIAKPETSDETLANDRYR